MPSDLDARARQQEREDRERWTEERAVMLAENQRLREQLARITKRFKLTQTALVEQQKVLDRYQQELMRCGSKAVHADADDSSVKKRNAENLCNDQTDCDPVKRARPASGKQRHSLPLAERHSPDGEVQSSPIRRRSLPEAHRPSSPLRSSGVVDRAWMTRKLDMESARAPPVINATELLRPRQLVRPRKDTHKSLPDTTHRVKEEHAMNADSDDAFLDDHVASGDKKIVVKAEPTPRERPPRRELPFRSHRVEPTTKNVPAFAYVEVVRNREERAALPAHDCDECRKYYEALDGLVAEDEMKATCSRHRARFKPYQTPDDFWRLSFPDSQSQDMMSP